MLRLFNRLLGRNENTLPPFDFARNKYPAKKKWPPNLRALTDKQQFRFERKFKRRIKMKSIRPQWNKWTKVVQWSLISFIVVYGVLFHDFRNDPMNPRPGEQVFEGLRKRMWGLFGGSIHIPKIGLLRLLSLREIVENGKTVATSLQVVVKKTSWWK